MNSLMPASRISPTPIGRRSSRIEPGRYPPRPPDASSRHRVGAELAPTGRAPSIVRACPTASSRQNGSGRSPRTAAAKSSSSHAYGSAGGTSITSVPPGPAHLDPRLRQCHGSGEEQRAGVADHLELVTRSTMSRPQSKHAEHAAGERERAGEAHVDAVGRGRSDLAPADALGLAGEQPHRAHAVAADVHQPAAVERRLQPHVVRPVRRRRGRTRTRARTSRSVPTAPLAHQLAQPPRLRVVAPHERLGQHAAGAVGGVERRLGLLRAAASAASPTARACRPPARGSTTARAASSAAACRPRRPRGRRAAPRSSRARGDPVLGRVRLGPPARRGWPPPPPRPPRRRGRRRGA